MHAKEFTLQQRSKIFFFCFVLFFQAKNVLCLVLGAVTFKFIYMYLISKCRFHMMYVCKENFLAVKVNIH